MNKYFAKGKKAKELLNLGIDKNPYPIHSRENHLWAMGYKTGVYINTKYEEIELTEHNSEIILGK